MRETLVLNRSFFAIQIISWDKVMSLLYRGQAVAVDSDYRLYDFDSWKEWSQARTDYPNGVVHGVNFSIAVPEIIQLTYFNELPRHEAKFNRKTLYQQYKQRCCYCGKRFSTSELNLDHVIPKSRGGKTNWENVITSCHRCNTLKGNRTPEEAGMQLHFKPSEPLWKPAYAVSLGSLQIKLSWRRFINMVYWNSTLEN